MAARKCHSQSVSSATMVSYTEPYIYISQDLWTLDALLVVVPASNPAASKLEIFGIVEMTKVELCTPDRYRGPAESSFAQCFEFVLSGFKEN